MILQIRKPAFPLNESVENLVYYHGLTALHNRDRLLPDGNTEIILDLTKSPQYIYDNKTLQEEKQDVDHCISSGAGIPLLSIPNVGLIPGW